MGGQNIHDSGITGNPEENDKLEEGDGASKASVAGDSGPEDEQETEERDREADLHGLFEAVLFISNEPLPLSFFVKSFGVDSTQAKIILDSLVDEYHDRDGGICITEISNGYQFVTSRRYAKDISRVMGFARKEGLTRSMLETLAIIAYKQPVVISEVDELRGVSSRMMVANLMKKNLIKPVGRKELPGRPLAYGTTEEFLRYFGLNKLSDLPRLSEIKEFAVPGEE
jgi:segregation and condensation protein B